MTELCVLLLAMMDHTDMHLDAMIARIAEAYVLQELGMAITLTAEDVPQVVLNAVAMVMPEDGDMTVAQGERVVQAICQHGVMQHYLAERLWLVVETSV